jgi:hypothetical protein
MIENGNAQMPSEKIIDVFWDACGCDALLAYIFAKTGENYSPRTQVFSPRIRVFSSRLSPRISPTGVLSPQGFAHRRKLTLIESRPRILLREKRFHKPILCRESAYRWHACVSRGPAALKLLPSILQTLNRDCTANPWLVLTRKKTFYGKRGVARACSASTRT